VACLQHFFPHCKLVSCICFVFWLVNCVACVCCDWSQQLLWLGLWGLYGWWGGHAFKIETSLWIFTIFETNLYFFFIFDLPGLLTWYALYSLTWQITFCGQLIFGDIFYLVDFLRYFLFSPSPLLGLNMIHDVFTAGVFPALDAILHLLQALFDTLGLCHAVIS